MTPERPLVTYMRVSTSKQGRSGLGLDAQRAALIHFAQTERFHIVDEFVEIDSGRVTGTGTRPHSSRLTGAGIRALDFKLLGLKERPPPW